MGREPAMIIGGIASLIALAIAFGVPLSELQANAILDTAAKVFVPLLLFLEAWIIRSQVTPANQDYDR